MKRIYRIIKKTIYRIIIKVKFKKQNTFNVKEDSKILDEKYIKPKITSFTKTRKNGKKVDLSIIIPLYNSEQFIKRSVESIINNKTKYKYEIILVNDGSVDNTQEIVDAYKNKYPNIIKAYSKKNGGISSARNFGLEHIDGKYISFLDQDDYIDSDYIEKMMNVAYSSDADIVRCGTANINNKNNKIMEKQNHKYVKIEGPMNEKIMDYSSYAWGCVVKETLLQNVKFYDGSWYEDMIWRFLVYRQSKCFIHMGEILHYRGIHTNQSSIKVWNNKNYKCLDQLYSIENLVNDNKKFNLKNDVYLYINVLHECAGIMVSRIDNIDDNVKQQIFIRAYKLLSSLYKKEYEKELKGDWKLKNDIILNKRYDLWLLLKNM